MTEKKEPRMVVAVVGLAVNEKGQFLLTQRHQPQDPEVHHAWQLPGGGMEYGETPEQTLAREMGEEIGVSCRILFPYPMVRTSMWENLQKPLHVTLMCYIISIGDQIPTLNDPETVNWKWYTLEEIIAPKVKTLPFTVEFVEEAIKILKSLE